MLGSTRTRRWWRPQVSRFPNLTFVQSNSEFEADLSQIEGTFDVVLLVDTIGLVSDCQALLERVLRRTDYLRLRQRKAGRHR